jgi:hypothetical protein
MHGVSGSIGHCRAQRWDLYHAGVAKGEGQEGCGDKMGKIKVLWECGGLKVKG